MGSKNQNLKALQLKLEKLEQLKNLEEYEKTHKFTTEDGLYINTKTLNDTNFIEYFNLKYQKDLISFNLENKEKNEQDFLENKIKEIKIKELENQRKWNLSDDDFYKEFKNQEIYKNKFKDSDLTDKEIKNHQIFIEYRDRFKPSEFEDSRLTLYKQKLNNLLNIQSTEVNKVEKVKFYGSQIEFVELIKALIENGNLKGKQKDIIKNCKILFDIEINNPSKTITDIKKRNNGSETLFLNRLQKSLSEYIKSKD